MYTVLKKMTVFVENRRLTFCFFHQILKSHPERFCHQSIYENHLHWILDHKFFKVISLNNLLLDQIKAENTTWTAWLTMAFCKHVYSSPSFYVYKCWNCLHLLYIPRKLRPVHQHQRWHPLSLRQTLRQIGDRNLKPPNNRSLWLSY